MSPIKAQTLFVKELDRINARHARHIEALMCGQSDFKKASELLELIKYYGAPDLFINATYITSATINLTVYPHHLPAAMQEDTYDAIVASGKEFSVNSSHSDDLLDVVFDGCTLRIVFNAEVLSTMMEAA